jgi:hypothetical protein
MQKKCRQCGDPKDHSMFRKSARYNDGLGIYCKDCLKARDKRDYAKSAERRRKVAESRDAGRQKNRAWLMNYLSDKACVDCGNKDWRVFHFDHIDPDVKSYNVSTLATSSYGLQTLQEEVEKCEIRCANCHMIKTGKQFGYWNARIIQR